MPQNNNMPDNGTPTYDADGSLCERIHRILNDLQIRIADTAIESATQQITREEDARILGELNEICANENSADSNHSGVESSRCDATNSPPPPPNSDQSEIAGQVTQTTHDHLECRIPARQELEILGPDAPAPAPQIPSPSTEVTTVQNGNSSDGRIRFSAGDVRNAVRGQTYSRRFSDINWRTMSIGSPISYDYVYTPSPYSYPTYYRNRTVDSIRHSEQQQEMLAEPEQAAQQPHSLIREDQSAQRTSDSELFLQELGRHLEPPRRRQARAIPPTTAALKPSKKRLSTAKPIEGELWENVKNPSSQVEIVTFTGDKVVFRKVGSNKLIKKNLISFWSDYKPVTKSADSNPSATVTDQKLPESNVTVDARNTTSNNTVSTVTYPTTSISSGFYYVIGNHSYIVT